MAGLEFRSFVVLTVFALIVSGGLHYGLKLYVRPGLLSFFSKLVLAWVGGWLGPPVFGFWGPYRGGIHLVPAFLGSLALVILIVDGTRTLREREGVT